VRLPSLLLGVLAVRMRSVGVVHVTRNGFAGARVAQSLLWVARVRCVSRVRVVLRATGAAIASTASSAALSCRGWPGAVRFYVAHFAAAHQYGSYVTN
jgi:hypothetical protein